MYAIRSYYGFKVQGFDLDEKRLRELHDRGGTPVESPAAAARGARWLITSLPSIDIVKEAVLGPNGVAEGAAKGLILADTTTSRPEDVPGLVNAVKEKNADMVIGSRYCLTRSYKGPFERRIGQQIFSYLTRLLIGSYNFV